MATNYPFWLVLVSIIAIALSYDIISRRIPNWLVLAGLLAGIGFSLFAPPGSEAVGRPGVGSSLLGVLSGFAIMLPLYALHAMGAGDTKLMAVVGAFLGPLPVVGAALLTFVCGGLLSLAIALWSRSLPAVLSNLRLMGVVLVSGRQTGLSLRDVQTTGRLPYSIAIAIGTGLQVWLAARGGLPFV